MYISYQEKYAKEEEWYINIDCKHGFKFFSEGEGEEMRSRSTILRSRWDSVKSGSEAVL